MILHRFCSHAELQAILRDGSVKNSTDHYDGGHGGSTSVGFCLTPEAPEKAWKYLKGIVTPGTCLRFDIPDNLLTPSTGKYLISTSVVDGKTVFQTGLKREYCIRELLYEWLRSIIPLETFVPAHELEAARWIERMKRSKENFATINR